MVLQVRRVAWLLALALVACREALGPGDVSGTYSLYRYDGAPLPRQYTTSHGCTVTVYSGQLTLGADATFSLDVERTRQCPGTASVEWVGYALRGKFSILRGELRLVGDTSSPGGLMAHLVGTHIFTDVPQPEGLSPPVVGAEFAAGGAVEITHTPGTEPGLPPQPLPDSGTVIVITKRR